MCPKEAAERIRRGDTPKSMRVGGRLDLTKFQGERLPAGLHCYELDASMSGIVRLPADLRVDGRLVLDACARLTSLPEGFKCGSISLRDCPMLQALPEGIDTWFLDLTGSAQFNCWPVRGRIAGGSLAIRNCVDVESLPAWIGPLASLDLAGCVRLTELPAGLEVSGWLDVGGSGLNGLPSDLEETPLRWRGVAVDERIAFRPEELTAKEALKEQNAELRRVMIERMGYLRFAEEAGAKTVDEDTDPGGCRQLLRINLDEDEPLVGLSCSCPSTGRQYFLRVPPNMKTCRQAAAWMAGFDKPDLYRPLIET